MTNSIPLVWIVNGAEEPQNPTSIQIYNLTVDTATEIKDKQASGSQSTGVGLLFDITGTSKFVLDGLSLNKVRFKCKIFEENFFVITPLHRRFCV